MLVQRAKMDLEAVASILEREPSFEVVSKLTSGLEAMECVGQLQPDIILLDERANGCSCAEATEQMSQLIPQSKIIILASSSECADYPNLLKLGARGFITKDITVEDFTKSIALVHSGEQVIIGDESGRGCEPISHQAEKSKPGNEDKNPT
jgi:DNA-binding NarL/FixJ family response regulator